MDTMTQPYAAPTDVRQATGWQRVASLATGVAALLALLLTAFAWPATQMAPRDLPLALAGPPPAVEQVQASIAEARPGAFDVIPVPDAAEAQRQVADREVAGALVLGPDGPRVIVATQGGTGAAQAISQLGTVVGGNAGVPVEDVAPAPADDPRGRGLAAGALPLVLAAAVAGGVLTLVVRGGRQRLAGAVLFAVLGGPTAIAVLHGWLGALTGNWLAESGVVALGLAAVSIAMIGVHAVFGRIGLVLAELTIVLLGNPLSAAPAGPSMLPDGWAELGQLLPPGAVVAALRSVSGFDGAGAAAPVTVLASWVLIGLALMSVARSRRDEPAA